MHTRQIRRQSSLCSQAYVLLAFALILFGCTDTKPAQAPRREAVPVSAATVAQKTMPVEIRAIGNVEPYASVAVKARVDGQIIEAAVRDGDFVQKGDLLFRLDPRPFEAQLKQAEATLARDRAELANARSKERRYRELLAQRFISQEAFLQHETNAGTAAASVQANEAAVENARIQLGFTRITAPINGRVGEVLLKEGNLVRANDATALLVINQMRPSYVDFAVPDQYLPKIRARSAQKPLKVEAVLAESGVPPQTGTLTFIDNKVDAATGTIQLKATFLNEDLTLWPGQFVDVVLRLAEQPNAIVVPSQAVQSGPKGPYVFVVKSDQGVEIREVVVDRAMGDETIIEKGLSPGELVVTNGQSRLSADSQVTVKPAAEPGPQDSLPPEKSAAR